MSWLGSAVPLASSSSIEIGKHVEATIAGVTFNLDTIWTTAVAGAIVLVLGFIARRTLTRESADHVPTKVQLIWETVVREVNTQVEDNLGQVQPFVAPLAISLFFFILFANWLELIPSKLNQHVHLLPAPTSDTNLTYAMALLVVVGSWVYGARQKGVGGYLKHLVEPFPWMLPLNILEELTKPISLALRLFGNIFAGSILLSLIALLPWYFGSPVLNILWKVFDMLIGGLQAFIFALLTVLYFGMAAAGHEEHEDDEENDSNEDHVDQRSEQSEQQPEPAHAG